MGEKKKKPCLLPSTSCCLVLHKSIILPVPVYCRPCFFTMLIIFNHLPFHTQTLRHEPQSHHTLCTNNSKWHWSHPQLTLHITTVWLEIHDFKMEKSSIPSAIAALNKVPRWHGYELGCMNVLYILCIVSVLYNKSKRKWILNEHLSGGQKYDSKWIIMLLRSWWMCK